MSLFTRSSNISRKKILILSGVIFLCASLGIADATFLTLSHNSGFITCTISSGCDTVLDSNYSEVFGMFPTAVLGMIFYSLIMILSLILALTVNSAPDLDHGKLFRPLWLLNMLSLTGVGFSLYFLHLQAFVIKAWCQYCLASATFTVLIFTLSAYMISKVGNTADVEV